MKADLKKVIWIVLGGIVAVSAISAWIDSRRSNDAKQSLEETRRALRAQGFKADLADFDVTIDDASRVRAAALTFLPTELKFNPNGDRVDLMPCVSNDTAAVIWKLDSLKVRHGFLEWPDFHEVLDTNRELLDAACNAAISAPIRFDLDYSLRDGSWDHQALKLWYLADALNSRMLLELHDGNRGAAWTNLLAVTRLVTAWVPAPQDFLHLFQASIEHDAFADTWQVFQSGSWPDEKLARLQREWESVNFFTNLSESRAVDCAHAIDLCLHLSQEKSFRRFSVAFFVNDLIRDPPSAYRSIKSRIEDARFRSNGVFVDEKNLLLYFHQRELELHDAIQSPTWLQMCMQPGVTNELPFKSEYRFLSEMIEYFPSAEDYLPARIAEAEAERRVLIVAIAVERYHGKYGVYPAALESVTPEFLKTVPVDFANGQPLHYRLTADGHFVLYSVGLDCVDDGGKMPLPSTFMLRRGNKHSFFITTNVDIVWPRPDGGSEGK